MAHEITSTDGLVLAGQPGWHRLGTVVKDAPTVKEAFRIAGLGWNVDRSDLYTMSDSGMYRRVDEYRANIREDTGEVLGIVGKDYSIFQNQDFAELLETAGVTQIETMGSLKGGRIVFGLSRTGTYGVGIGGADEVHQYTLFSNRHDGSGALRIYPTDIRVVCANTHTYAERKAGDSGVTVRHSKGMADSLKSMQKALQYAVQGNAKMMQRCIDLANKPLRQHELEAFFAEVYRRIYGTIPTKIDTEAAEKKLVKAQKQIAQWAELMDDPQQRIAGIQGTAWAAYNCITHWADHLRRTRRTAKSDGETVQDSKAYASLFGAAANAKQVAMQAATELVTA